MHLLIDYSIINRTYVYCIERSQLHGEKHRLEIFKFCEKRKKNDEMITNMPAGLSIKPKVSS